MYMRHILGLSVQVVELDPLVADLASHHFGFVADEQLQVSGTFSSGCAAALEGCCALRVLRSGKAQAAAALPRPGA